VLAPKDFNPVAMPLATSARARAGTLTGDRDESRKSHDALLAPGKDADADVPLLREVRREYGRRSLRQGELGSQQAPDLRTARAGVGAS
jgi:hypothetical protein